MGAQEGARCRSLLEWVNAVQAPEETPAQHHRLLLDELRAISRGDIDRLMVLMPPGSGKSTYGNVNTNLWGQYVPTPPTPGSWYVWAEGTDGSHPTIYPTSFPVT